MSKQIAQVVVGLPVEGPFDYSIRESDRKNIAVGSRVLVPFSFRSLVGYVVALKSSSRIRKIKPLTALLDDHPALDAQALALAREFSRYYACSLGEAIEAGLPSALRRKKEINWPAVPGSKKPAGKQDVLLCHDQGAQARWPFLRDKVKEQIEAGRSVLVLVPEISQIAMVEEQIAGPLECSTAVLDKKLSAARELENWRKVKQAEARLIIGTRSAVFAPAADLGLIVVCEEENTAFKQEQSPFYHVREVALMRQKTQKASLVFVSSAPTAELWWALKKKKGGIVSLPPEHLSDLQVIDLTNYKKRAKASLAYPLQSAVQKTLNENGKVVLFLNKKGFSSSTRCNQCGYTVKCERCDVNMVYLYAKKNMICPLCSTTMDMPKVCPQCSSAYLRSLGGGIEKLESNTARFFPGARIAKCDSDTTTALPNAEIYVATQAILKELPKLKADLIAVLDADAELNRSDFRASQKVFSLLMHLRQSAQKKVMVQTNQPGDYCLQAAARGDFKKFYSQELKFRRELGFPPFKHLVAVMLRGKSEETVLEQAKELFLTLREKTPAQIEVMDPQPDLLPKLRDKYRYTIMIKGKKLPLILATVQSCLKEFKKRKGLIVTVNVDP